jgi:hypothetical protein
MVPRYSDVLALSFSTTATANIASDFELTTGLASNILLQKGAAQQLISYGGRVHQKLKAEKSA